MAEDYVIEDGVLMEYKGISGGIIIPSDVHAIADRAFSGNRYITEVDMSQSCVQQIGSHAFQDCVNLVTVKMSENLKIICGSAFRGCVSLSKIYLPRSIETIEECAFMQCKRLQEVQIGMNTGERQRAGGIAVDGEYIHNGGAPLNVGDSAFSDCGELVNINLTARLHKLGRHAFEGCGKISEIILYLEGNTYIADEAFSDCKKVTVKYRGCKQPKKWWQEKFSKGTKLDIRYNF